MVLFQSAQPRLCRQGQIQLRQFHKESESLLARNARQRKVNARHRRLKGQASPRCPSHKAQKRRLGQMRRKYQLQALQAIHQHS